MRNGHKGRMACGILELMLGVGLILSTMYVFVRDIMHIWEVFCTLLVFIGNTVASLLLARINRGWEGEHAV